MVEWVIETIAAWGYLGVFLLMLLENLFPPLPSEVIMPLAGYVAARGDLHLGGVIAAGTAGAVVGAYPWYYLGLHIGHLRLRALVSRVGRWLAVYPQEVDDGVLWFQRHGAKAVLIARVLPGIRTFISAPAGMACVPIPLFTVLTAIGTLAWVAGLAAAGVVLQENYAAVAGWIDPVGNVIFVGGAAFYVYRVVTFRPA